MSFCTYKEIIKVSIKLFHGDAEVSYVVFYKAFCCIMATVWIY